MEIALQRQQMVIGSAPAAVPVGAPPDGSAGRLGDGMRGIDSDRPVPVQGGYTFVSVAAGSDHTCGVIARAVCCWGQNRASELGDGNTNTDSDRPVLVEGALLFTSVAAGNTHTCGVTSGGRDVLLGRQLLRAARRRQRRSPQPHPGARDGAASTRHTHWLGRADQQASVLRRLEVDTRSRMPERSHRVDGRIG